MSNQYHSEQKSSLTERLIDTEQNQQIRRSQLQLIFSRFQKNRLGCIGLLGVCIFILLSIGAPFFAPYDHVEQDYQRSYLPPQSIHFFDQDDRFHFVPFTYKYKKIMDPETFVFSYEEDRSKRFHLKFFTPGFSYKLMGLVPIKTHFLGVEEPGTIFLLGTDAHGRDLLSRILYGGRISLSVALLGALVTGIVGTTIGSISGYYSGIIDVLLQRLVELVQCFPQLALWMVLSVAFPPTWPPLYILYGIVGIFSLLSWPLLAREIRGKVLSYRNTEFVLAAEVMGVSAPVIIARHIIPHVASHIVVALTIAIPSMILAESTLSFLGLGIRPPMVSWGRLLRDAQSLQTLNQHPWMMIPGGFIVLAVMAFNFLGDGLRDAIDPYSK